MKWSLGFATKNGMIIQSEDGEKILIPKVEVGNMYAPDPDAFEALFLSRIGEGDVVISPSGPNYTYLPGAHARGAKVFWLHAGLLKGVKQVPQALLKMFDDNRNVFYEYQPQDAGVAALGIITRQLINLQRQRAGDENAYSQMLRRERDFFRFATPDRDGWINRHVAEEQRKFEQKLRKTGVRLSTEQKAQLDAGIRDRIVRLYDVYFGVTPEDKEAKRALLRAKEELVRDHMEWFGVDVAEAFYGREVEHMLDGMPENGLFDGLIGAGAVKTRAQILTYMRNPLLYPNAAALRGYAGMNVVDGQAERRTRGEASHGNPEFRRALCFDFAEKYWQNDPIGFFRGLYYAYKAHQYYTYWELMVLTADVFSALRMSEEEDESVSDSDTGNGAANGNGHTREVSPNVVRALVERVATLTHLDIIERNGEARRVIERLRENPDPRELARLFSRSTTRSGLNLQMTPRRVESQTKRFLGITLLEAIYYRWMAQLGQPLPVADDKTYLRRWRTVTANQDGVPTTYDHEIVLTWLRAGTAELAAKRPLPPEITIKFIPPKERAGAAPAVAA